MSGSSYRYKPLVGNEIRLVQLTCASQVSSASGLVECKLCHSSLDSTVEYNSLSYAWGNPTITEPIVIDGINFQVTSNLAAALKAFSKSEGFVSSPLWVDAVCINQEDIAERSYQVSRMTKIYQGAKEVFVWLGPCSPAIEVALPKLLGLEKILEPAETELMRRTGKALWRDIFTMSSEKLREYMDPNSLEGEQLWSGLEELYDLPWWNRTWILQEVASAKKLRLICGELSFDLPSMRAADFSIRAVRSDPKLAYSKTVSGFKMRYVFSVFRFKDICEFDSRLLNLLSRGRLSAASDPRDKVYAFLSLATDVTNGSLLPNYHLSQWKIYTQIAIWSILEHNDLEIISHCFPYGLGSDILPSWVPDWSIPILPPNFEHTAQSNGSLVHSYHASKDSLVYRLNDNKEELVQADRYLSLNGIKLGRIERLTTSNENENGTEVQKLWMPINSSEIYNWTGETLDMAFRRTIVRDISPMTGSRGYAYDFDFVQNGNFLTPAISALSATHTRRLAYTENALMGLVPKLTKVGDFVFVLCGGSVVYILRNIEENRYAVIGEAYFHGMMDGEAMEKVQQGVFNIEKIILE